MVEVTEIHNEETTPPPTTTTLLSQSEERALDADEIESLSQKYATRTSVKAHLESLAQKIRRDAKALKRMEDSKVKADEDENMVQVEEVETKPVSKPTTTTATATAPPVKSSLAKYQSIDKFAFDAGSYNSPTVSIYISLPNIGNIPRENITCDFKSSSFDLKIHDFPIAGDGNNKTCNYRLLKDNLEKDIDAKKSKMIIKADKIVIKLGKVKGEYGSYESWMDLTSKKSKESKMKSKNDPSAGIMDLMKEMYDSGDDNMKKMIGETMLKQREGKLNTPGMGMGMDDM